MIGKTTWKFLSVMIFVSIMDYFTVIHSFSQFVKQGNTKGWLDMLKNAIIKTKENE